MKKIPQRTCMGCGLKKDKTELIRIVKSSQGDINIDKTGKQNGRGAYICNNIGCLEKVIKSKKLDKVFEMKLSDEIYNNLRNLINGGELIG